MSPTQRLAKMGRFETGSYIYFDNTGSMKKGIPMVEKVEKLIQDGIKFLHNNDFNNAKKTLEEALSLEPLNREANALLGSTLVRLGNNEDALKKFEKVGNIDSLSIISGSEWRFVLYDWGLALERQATNPHRYEEAAKLYEATVNADNANASAWNNWGRMLFELKQYDEAIDKYKKAIEYDVVNAHYYYRNLGLALEKQEEKSNRFEEASKQYEAAVNSNQTYADAWNDWGRMLINLKQYEEAIEKFKKAIEYGTVYKHFYHRNWGLALEKQDKNPNRHEEAAKQYEAAVNTNQTYADAWNDWGRMLYELRRYDEAIEKYKKAVDYSTAYEHIFRRNLGLALEKQNENPNRHEEAAKQYETAVNIDKTYADAWNDWGLMLISLKQYEEAIEKFKKAIEFGTSYKHFYHRNWGLALEKQDKNPNRYEEAAKQYEAAVDTNQTYADAWNDWGRMLFELMRYDDAIEKYKKAAEYNTVYEHIFRRNWGLALEKQEENPDRFEEAAKQYEAAVNADKDYADAWNDWGIVLINLKLYEEAINKFNKAIEINPEFKYAYFNLGWVLVKLKSFSNAIKQYEKVIELDPYYMEAYNFLGLTMMDVKKYSGAEQQFLKIIELDPIPPTGYRNLAFLLDKQGKFMDSSKMWGKALKAYEAIPENSRSEYDWYFIAHINLYIFQNYERSMTVLGKGLEKFPESTQLLRTCLDLNLELKSYHSYMTPKNLEATGSAHWRAWDSYQKLKSILEEKLEKGESASVRALLGSIHKATGETAAAEENLSKAIELDPTLATAFNDLGALKALRKDFEGAIQDFEAAINKEPHDFGYISNLAEAYQKIKRLDDAEKTYQKILGITQSHIDSLIGLAETYTIMGDTAVEGSYSADAEMMYKQAIEYYTKAIEYETQAARKKQGEPRDASKRLKPMELSAVYYSRGYARVSLYDAQTKKSEVLLLQARNDFRKVIKYEADDNYFKAKRALSKISERLNPLSSQNIEQRTGPMLISFLAFLLFAISLFAFFKGKPEFSPPVFVLNDKTLMVLKLAKLQPEAVQGLDALVGKEFSTKEGLLEAVKLIVGKEAFKSYEKIIVAQPFETSAQLQWKTIEFSYFSLMAFGSLIFMVAGLYLQQISKLKFASIEIEKSPVNQISSSVALHSSIKTEKSVLNQISSSGALYITPLGLLQDQSAPY